MADDDPWESQNLALGAFIRSQRKLASLSLRQLSDMTDVSNAYLSQIERGLHEPSIRVLKNVSQALGVPPETLLRRAGLLADDEDVVDDEGGGTQAEPDDPPVVTTEEAIMTDPRLSEGEKQALLSVYRSYVADDPADAD